MNLYLAIGAITSLTAIFVLVLRRVDLGLSLLIGSLILGSSSLSIEVVLRVILKALTSRLTIGLALAVVFITLLGFLYQETGKLTELSKELGKLVPDNRFIVTAIPAIFGTLPAMGGALLSAPVVDEEGRKMNAKGEWKTFVNLWFIHVIFLVYPLSTFIIIASYLSGLEVSTIALYEIPVFIAAIIAGSFVAFRGVKASKSKFKFQKIALKRVLILLLPILTAITLNGWLEIDISLAAIVGIIMLLFISKPSLKIILRATKRSRLHAMVSAVLGVMIFREMVSFSGLPHLISNAVQTLSLPKIFPLTSIPFVLGFLTGSATGAVAIAIPVLYTNGLNLASIGLIYTSCLMGYVISPLHLCFTLTSEYFKTKIVNVYPKLIIATVATITAQIIISMII